MEVGRVLVQMSHEILQLDWIAFVDRIKGHRTLSATIVEAIQFLGARTAFFLEMQRTTVSACRIHRGEAMLLDLGSVPRS